MQIQLWDTKSALNPGNPWDPSIFPLRLALSYASIAQQLSLQSLRDRHPLMQHVVPVIIILYYYLFDRLL